MLFLLANYVKMVHILNGVIYLANRETLIKIKRNVENHLGEKVILKTNKGRKKVKIKEGVLVNTYKSVFTVTIDSGLESERKISFSYSDILTETVEVTLILNNEKIFAS